MIVLTNEQRAARARAELVYARREELVRRAARIAVERHCDDIQLLALAGAVGQMLDEHNDFHDIEWGDDSPSGRQAQVHIEMGLAWLSPEDRAAAGEITPANLARCIELVRDDWAGIVTAVVRGGGESAT